MNYTVKKDKRKRRVPWRLILIVALLLAILGGGMKFGLIPGGQYLFGDDGIYPQDKPAPEETPPKDVTIVVTENQVTVNDQAMDMAGVEEFIQQSGENDTFQVKDNQAIKDTYERVIELLKQYNREYSLVD